MIRGGGLRHVVTIEQPVNTKGAMGGSTNTWESFATGVRVGIEPISGTKKYNANAPVLDTEIEAECRMYYRTGLTEAMRLNHNGTYWYIKRIINKGSRNRELELLLSSGLRDG